jgi:hypothetical protein
MGLQMQQHNRQCTCHAIIHPRGGPHGGRGRHNTYAGASRPAKIACLHIQHHQPAQTDPLRLTLGLGASCTSTQWDAQIIWAVHLPLSTHPILQYMGDQMTAVHMLCCAVEQVAYQERAPGRALERALGRALVRAPERGTPGWGTSWGSLG